MPTLPTKLLAVSALLACAATGCDHEPHDLPLDDEADAEPDAVARPGATALGAAADPAGAAADCCATDSAPGCSDLAVESCVCAADPYCCNTAWDSLCVNEVASLGCGTCDTTMPCCTAETTPGCEEPSIESCVCAADSYCCNTAWDSICVNEVTSLGCGTCGAVDLAITDLDVPATACPGEDIGPSMALELTNVGTAGVTSMFHVGWYLSSDTTLGAGDRLLLGGRDQVASLAAGASTSVSINVNQIPGDATPGAQYLIVTADEFDGVVETDEDNNVMAIPITIEPECVAGSEWAQSLGGTDYEDFVKVATDADGNVYVLGPFFSDPIDLGAGPQARQGSSDVFLVSYDADGLYRWSRRMGSDGGEHPGAVGVDAAGNVYVTGSTWNQVSPTSLDLGGGPLTPTGGVADLFVASYTSTGAHRWSQRYGAPGGTWFMPTDVAVESDGDMVAIGTFSGSMSLGGPLLTSDGMDMFVLALDSSGAHRWSRLFGGAGAEDANGVAVDGSGGAAITGAFSGSVDFGSGALVSAGAKDGVLVRLSATGATQWARRYGSTFTDVAHDVKLDTVGNAYIVGSFAGTVNLGDGPRTAGGTSEALIASYGPAGTLRWSRRGGGAGSDDARGIALDGDGHPVVIGSFIHASAEFGGAVLPNAGGHDTWYASFTSSTGGPRWSSRLGTAASEWGDDIAASPAGAVVLAGTFSSTLPVVGTTLVTEGANDVFVVSIQP